ncbi:hypothetical protein VTK56DRAFT_8824 [Thermocarpiscus australiensis]
MALSSRISNAITRRTFTATLPHLNKASTITTRSTAQIQKRPFTHSLNHPVQIYRSTSTDPYLNLSIEHHLLQHSHPDSTVLFIYANRPCVVIGRNQNPWLEVNLHQLRQGLPPPPPNPEGENVPVALVRRRSGGGAVFHDHGNLNWSVICPPAVFDRDRHAAMVVRALRRLGVRGARVNERHDIVVDVDVGGGVDVDVDEGSGVAGAGGGERGAQRGQTFKVSGSAYKLTRTRSLHHGTCLLNSPYLGRVSGLLRSPAEGFIKARGVESVRSRIMNVGVGTDEFVEGVADEFRRMYGDGAGAGVVVGEQEALATEDVVKGVRELTSPEWVFGQTPQFTFSTHPTEDDPRERPPLPDTLPTGFQAHLTFRHGEIQSAAISGLEYHDFVDEDGQDKALSQALVKQRLHNLSDWRATLKSASPVLADADEVGEWLNHMFGIETPEEEGDFLGQTVVQSISDAIVGSYLH